VQRKIRGVMRAVVSAVLMLAVGACKPHAAGRLPPWQASATATSRAELVAVPRPALAPSIFPCSDCHADMKPNLERRELENHEEIVLSHGGPERWCLDCHDPDHRDELRLKSGARVPLAEADRLCGECHGERHRDWKLGLHGKRMGMWTGGAKQYLLCPACHDPHAPHFKPIAPLPPPPHPELLGAGS
jgi:hypothetical protein